MAFAQVNKSGCCERHGNVQVRFDFFLEPTDPRYNDTVVLIGEGSEQKSQLTSFHSHFARFNPDVTDAEIKAEMDFHLPNFYLAYQNKWDKVAGGMRHGFAVEKRIRSIHYTDQYRKECALDRIVNLSIVKSGSIVASGIEFPSTEIDVGYEPEDLASSAGPTYTLLLTHNVANATGIIDTMEIWNADVITMTAIKIGMFYGSGTTFTPRDYESLGTAAPSQKTSFTGLECSVTIGDMIGFYAESAGIERADSTASYFYAEGDKFGGEYASYEEFSPRILSLYGTGTTDIPGGGLPSVGAKAILSGLI